MNRTQWIIAIIFMTQIIYALAYAPLTGTTDFYPLHKWALFGQIQKNYKWPILYIKRWGDQEWENSVNYYDFFFRNPRIDFLPGQDLVFDWFILREEGKLDEAQHKRKAFERHFFKNAKNVEYSIRVVELNQLEFMKERKIRSFFYEDGPFHYGADGE